MSAEGPFSDSSNTIAAEASAWLARRDRGLTAAEQDQYLQWLRDDPRHKQAMVQVDAAWGRLDALAEWRPHHADRPNPDLLAPRASRWRRHFRPLAYSVVALAAAVAAGVFVLQYRSNRAARTALADHGVHVLPRAEQITLPDGSVVEVKAGGRVQAAFTTAERRVRLLQGEALFTVTKNPARPFVVEVGAVAVRAVGTAFDVRRGSDEIEVLVTEGRVHVERSHVAGHPPALTPLDAGQRAIVDTADLSRPPVVSSVTAAELERALAWQAVQLEFSALPLAEVVSEFNLRNSQQIVIADAEVGKLRLGGTFRTDNVEAFVRLVEASLGVKADRRDDGTIVLRRGN